MIRFSVLLCSVTVSLLCVFVSQADTEPTKFITVASTTSTQNSGLYDHLLPIFTAKSGIQVRVVAVGTGQAIRLGKNGDADVLLVHHRASEEDFVKQGFGVKRFDVMYNDFVVAGPVSDPAGIGGLKDAVAALSKIARKRSLFVSRSDDSGTHKKEQELWKEAGIDAVSGSGQWYLETGQGMGAALNVAAGKGAYIVVDRGTWLSFDNKADLKILVEGDKRLFNPYGVILVSPTRHPHIKAKAGQEFIDWIISKDGQAAIGSYKRNSEQLFFPNAHTIRAPEVMGGK